MVGSGGRNGQRNGATSPMDALNLRPCLVHVPTGGVVMTYTQLSKIVKRMGWKVFIDVTANIWSAWYLPAGDGCLIQMVFLPHPHLSAATYYQLSTVVQALGSHIFNISSAPLKKFRDIHAYGELQKPILRVKATGRKIFTIRALSRVLVQHGWRKESECHFIKREVSGNERSPINLVSVIKFPNVEFIHQLSVLDIEYISMVTANLFYLQSPLQPPRKRERNPRQRTSAPGNSVKKVTEDSSKTKSESSAQKASTDSPGTSSEGSSESTTT